jgi:hypothetical protein
MASDRYFCYRSPVGGTGTLLSCQRTDADLPPAGGAAGGAVTLWCNGSYVQSALAGGTGRSCWRRWNTSTLAPRSGRGEREGGREGDREKCVHTRHAKTYAAYIYPLPIYPSLPASAQPSSPPSLLPSLPPHLSLSGCDAPKALCCNPAVAPRPPPDSCPPAPTRACLLERAFHSAACLPLLPSLALTLPRDFFSLSASRPLWSPSSPSPFRLSLASRPTSLLHRGPSLSRARRGACSVALGSCVLVFGGWDGSAHLKDCEWLDTAAADFRMLTRVSSIAGVSAEHGHMGGVFGEGGG